MKEEVTLLIQYQTFMSDELLSQLKNLKKIYICKDWAQKLGIVLGTATVKIQYNNKSAFYFIKPNKKNEQIFHKNYT